MKADLRNISKEALEAIADAIPAGVVVIEKANGKIAYVNEKAISLYGVDPRGLELPEHSTKLMKIFTLNGEIYPPEQLPASKALLTGKEAKDELIIERSDGSRVIVDASAKPIKDKNGQVIAAVGIFDDITERKKGEEALSKSERKYRELFNSMTEAFQLVEIVFDKNGEAVDWIYRDVNPVVEKILRRSREQLIDKSAKQLLGFVEPYWLELFYRVAKTGVAENFENYGKATDKWYSLYAWKAGENLTAALVEDATERKKAEEALQSSEKRKSDILESITDGFVAFDKEWRYTYVNSNAARILHTPKEKLIGKVALEVFPNASKFLAEFKRAVSSGRPVHFEEYYPEPLNIWYECHCYPSQNGLTVFFSDITQRKKAEEALKESANRLSRIAQAGQIGFFEYNATKDIAYWSPEHYDLFGYERDSIISMLKWLQGVYPEDRQRIQDNFAQLMKEGQIKGQVQGHKDEYRYIRPDKSVIWVESELSLSTINNEVILQGSVRNITERKKAEEALRSSEVRFRSLYENSFDAVLLTKPDGQIITANPAAQRMFCMTEEEIQKAGRKGIVITDERAEAALKERALVGKVKAEFTFRRKDGSTFEGEATSGLFTDSDGIVKTSMIIRDITERKAAEDALRISEERFSKAFNASPAAVSISRLSDGLLIDVNEAYLQVFDFTRQEAIGHTSTELGIFIDSRSRKEAINLLKEKGHIRSTEFKFKTKSGKIIHTLIALDIIALDKEQFLISTVLDITERKKAEEKLAYSGLLLEYISDAVIGTDPAFTITSWNNGAQAIYGFTSKEAIGKRFTQVIETKYLTGDSKQVMSQFLTEGVWSGEVIQKTKEGKELYIYSTVTLIKDNDGNTTAVVAINRDITDRKKAEMKLKEYQQNLEKLVEERTKQLKDSERLATIGATAGMVGHDIRNPLQAITGDLFLAKSELSALPENENKINALESLDEIQNNIDYINKIVADLQDYARPLNPRAQESNIKSVFNEILAKNGIPKNIKVTVEVEDKAENIMADPDYLKRIAANLTLNAVQAMPDGGRLTIHAYCDKQSNDVLITVKDTGVGIPEDVKPKLFTPMMTTKSKGQGFGLAVVKRMSEGLGGTVTFESQEGKGTTFIVRLPPPKS